VDLGAVDLVAALWMFPPGHIMLWLKTRSRLYKLGAADQSRSYPSAVKRIEPNECGDSNVTILQNPSIRFLVYA
jgi:hypothetical protein